MTAERVLEILAEAKKLAREFRALTGKPLGVTGEVAEYEAARILGVNLQPARQAGYDATETIDGQVRRLQIKGRCVLDGSKPGSAWARSTSQRTLMPCFSSSLMAISTLRPSTKLNVSRCSRH